MPLAEQTPEQEEEFRHPTGGWHQTESEILLQDWPQNDAKKVCAMEVVEVQAAKQAAPRYPAGEKAPATMHPSSTRRVVALWGAQTPWVQAGE